MTISKKITLTDTVVSKMGIESSSLKQIESIQVAIRRQTGLVLTPRHLETLRATVIGEALEVCSKLSSREALTALCEHFQVPLPEEKP